MQFLTIVTFILALAVAGIYTYKKMKKGETASGSEDSYFLGGRSLTWGVIGMSLLLTNMNPTQFVGMSGQVFSQNMSNMAYEVTSGFVLAIVALLLVPRYLKQGLTTIPQFLEYRFDKQTKSIVSILFMILFIINIIPTTLYAGAVALSQIFDVQELFGLTFAQGIWLTVWIVGIIGFFYAILGGLRAVAISDTFNGVALAIGGLLVPIFALVHMGHGNFAAGFAQFVSSTPEKFNAIGSLGDAVPFNGAIVGLLLVNFYYWGTDQSIIQRALAAKNLEHSQKGVMLCGLLKTFTPILVILPGIMAFQMIGNDGSPADTMYAKLVLAVLPKWLLGLFSAAMFGSILSVYNGVLNSASTLFAINVYKPRWGKGKSDKQIISAGKKFGIVIAIISMIISPMIMYAPAGLFQFTQTLSGFFNVPIFTIIFMGYVTKKVPAIAAKLGLLFFIVVYGVLQLVIQPQMSFLYQLLILFAVTCLLMLAIGKIKPRSEEFVLETYNMVELKEWSHRYEAAWFITFLVIFWYIIFSPLGLASAQGAGMHTLMYIAVAAVICIIGAIITKKKFVEQSHTDDSEIDFSLKNKLQNH
ncbi:solute:sodium symporter family transporter [Pectinatus brassicae]|uniref:SSS family solute:Na+ symporter n=1 Tax=Pectinatus brassicae TaxID=862415 RepID=A0A840UGR5_9FIRM|nr:solute:sodium symporter family transporter [Pectinatus brassicae]MBB5336316.1 SSS family solute:Na+ symporter [Pectinatus brassicae]